jgi:hypothetical protein
MTIWKFPVSITDHFDLMMPVGSQILSVQTQGVQGPQLWALVDPDAPKVSRGFRVIGTGNPIDDEPERLKFIDTFQLHNLGLVFHVFEKTEVA